jgi:GntR family transcriptional repressor for pyruvate dehydrogenase complex
MEFKPIPRLLVHETIIAQIKDYIIHNKLAPGDLLPSERQLAGLLNVSRNSIREAYKALEAEGLVKIYHGKGIFLADSNMPIAQSLLSIPQTPLLHKALELMEIRRVIEPGAISIAQTKLTEAKISHLGKILEAEENPDTKKPSTLFEQEIVKMTENAELIKLEDSVAESWLALWSEIGQGVLSPEARYKDHLNVFKALQMRKPDLAKRYLERHHDTVLGVIVKCLSGKV